jgi:ferric-dicitrate binding protein FerR (iron transport regulator)
VNGALLLILILINIEMPFMPSTQSYANFTAIELATDPDFIAWVKYPDHASNLFWGKFIVDYPAHLPILNSAKAIVNKMKMREDTMDEQRAMQVWNNIEKGVFQETSGKKGSNVVSMRKWWMAAAVLLLLATGGYFFWKKEETVRIAKTTTSPSHENDIAPGTNKAILTLGDGRNISLDSASNGAISKQGNVTIIQLDGKLSYEVSKESLSNIEVTYNTIVTPKGGQYQLVLADGSKVWLNAASSLRFPTVFTGNERRVQLNGEGYFEIAHDAAAPFIVEKGDTRVQVLGTHFNVNAYDDENQIQVTLLEGSVSVSRGNMEKRLMPGQQAQIDSDIQIVDRVNIDKVMAWKNGWFEFDDTELSAIMRQISRWYDVDVVFEEKSLNQNFGGRISKNLPLSAILQMLQSSGVKGFRLEGKKLYVQP